MEQWTPTFLAPGTSFVEDSHGPEGGGWFQDDSSALYFCALFLLLLHQLDLRPSGIRSWRLETPVLGDSLPYLRHVLLCSLFISLSLGLQKVFIITHHRPCGVNIVIMISPWQVRKLKLKERRVITASKGEEARVQTHSLHFLDRALAVI